MWLRGRRHFLLKLSQIVEVLCIYTKPAQSLVYFFYFHHKMCVLCISAPQVVTCCSPTAMRTFGSLTDQASAAGDTKKCPCLLKCLEKWRGEPRENLHYSLSLMQSSLYCSQLQENSCSFGSISSLQNPYLW